MNWIVNKTIEMIWWIVFFVKVIPLSVSSLPEMSDRKTCLLRLNMYENDNRKSKYKNCYNHFKQVNTSFS